MFYLLGDFMKKKVKIFILVCLLFLGISVTTTNTNFSQPAFASMGSTGGGVALQAEELITLHLIVAMIVTILLLAV